ncbi:ATP-binding cassette domain-containing protein [Eggerthellaceae bacterium zg-1084]|uniref:ATP-binding cassette domain-containing protein n=1 Tax=Berryella wangjianweii TaxID=2734634 RepID=A0A6M8IZV8_9ACTN|nr:ATP-binding cassette domain-containing protein [Berryella wangjianweii]NPD30599.1 ATP-binding cassette domain-containing protein [Berryella wangjianweii]QKF07250.1 ATP-binding cassette domain-containing protein [Berryella wangjianweii]
MEPILEVRDLCVSYDGKPALSDVSAQLAPQRVCAIVGPSGCGKSTLVKSMNLLTDETPGARVQGERLLRGRSMASIPVTEVRRRVGLVFQTPTPFPFSIERNLSQVMRLHGMRDRHQIEERVVRLLETVGLYREVKGQIHKSARALSGGQMQRLCIARALAAEPEALLMDEPCSALDVRSTQVIEELIASLKERYAVALVTHNLAQARRLGDDALFLEEGRVVEAGPAARVLHEPARPETRAFLML